MASAGLLQGPSSGSPFVDAPLPFDELKAPPESAFEILMICLGVSLLAALVTAAFLAVGKLGSLQEQLRKEFAQRAKAREADQGEDLSAPSAALQASVDELRTSLEASSQRMDERLGEWLSALADRSEESAHATGSGTDAPLDPRTAESMQQLTSALASFHGSAESQSSRLADQLETLARAIADMPSVFPAAAAAVPASASASSDANSSTAASVVQAIRANLSAQGYTHVEIITSPADMDAELLGSGQMTVEAKRGGAIFKGRVLLEDGQVVDAQLRPSHQIFP